MAVHHKFPRKLYSNLANDLVSYGGDGKVGFNSKFDIARMMRAEKEKTVGFYRSLAEVSHIDRKRLGQIARMTGDDPKPWEIAAIRSGMKALKQNNRKTDKDR